MIAASAVSLLALAAQDTRTLADVAEAYPERAALVHYGAEDALQWALRIGAPAEVERPSVTVVPAFDAPPDAAVLVALAEALCAAEDVGTDYWILGAGELREPALARDFPSGWVPPVGVRGAYPLSTPATRALAEHLSFLPRGAALVELRARSLAEAHDDRGTLLRFAREHLDLPAMPLVVSEGGAHLAARVARIAAGVARLELREPIVRRLSADLWEIECGVGNAGTLAAAPRRRLAAHPDRRCYVRVSGAPLLAGAVERAPGAGEFEVLPIEPQLWDLGGFAGGSERRVRLVVRGARGDLVSIDVGAARAHSGRAAVELEATPLPR